MISCGSPFSSSRARLAIAEHASGVMGVWGSPSSDRDTHVVLLAWVLLVAACSANNGTRHAVCVTGQLRVMAGSPELQRNVWLAVVRPLRADVFMVVSAEHALAHDDYHLPTNGCYTDRRKCAPRDWSQDNKEWRRQSGPPVDLDLRKWGKRAIMRAAATEAEIEQIRGGPLRPRAMRVLVTNPAPPKEAPHVSFLG